MSRNDSAEITLWRIRIVCKVWRAERQDLHNSAERFHFSNEPCIVWISSQHHLHVSDSGMDTRKLLSGGKCGFLFVFF